MPENKTERIFLLGLIVATAVLVFYIFRPFLMPLALAAVFAVVLQPLYRRIHRLMGAWESVASLLTVVISIVCIILPVALLSTVVVREAQQFYVSLEAGTRSGGLDNALDAGEEWLRPYVPNIESLRQTVTQNFGQYARQGAAWLALHLGTAFTGLASAILSLFIFLIALYYLLRDGGKLKAAVMRMSPLAEADEESVAERLSAAVNSVVKGSLLVALVQAVLTAIGFTIFGVPNSILWGTATFFAALIPGVGTALVFIPVILFMFLSGNITAAIGLAVWGAVAVGTIDNFLGPRLVSRGMNLHPLLLLPGVLGGIAFFGIAGIFLGPLTLSFFFAIMSIYASRERV